MKTLWKLTKEAARYKGLYIIAILSTFGLTAVNLAAPKVLSAMTGIVEKGVDDITIATVRTLALILLGLYLLRVLFRFLSNYLAHRAAWYLVGELRSRLYNKLQSLDLGFFHDKQTGDLMSRVVNDTRDFELLYAHMIPDILHMPEQYETQVGERGLRLSGGQKQRVAIARAILRNSPIIILDEATASVDVSTERQIQAAISELAGKRTIVAIAHRLSTIMNADLILVIQEGAIVESGTHAELMEKQGYYYKMQQAAL